MQSCQFHGFPPNLVILSRDIKFVFFPNSNFVCKIRILFELRLDLRYIMVSSVHHYTARKYRQAIKTNAYDLLCKANPHYVLKTKALYKLVNNSLSSVFSDLKLQKAKKKLLFTNNKLAATIDHVIALLFNVSSRPVPLSTNVRRNSQVRIISL